MTTMIERIAREIHADAAKQGSVHSDFDVLMEEVKGIYRSFAIAALGAMREPTEAMEKSADGIAYSQRYGRTNAVWRAMIDAAIQEHKQGEEA